MCFPSDVNDADIWLPAVRKPIDNRIFKFDVRAEATKHGHNTPTENETIPVGP